VLEFRYVAGPQWHGSREDSIRAGLAKKLGDDFAVSFLACADLEKTNAGKHRWLISYLQRQV
jgi:phenylacetate-CoA ligase